MVPATHTPSGLSAVMVVAAIMGRMLPTADTHDVATIPARIDANGALTEGAIPARNATTVARERAVRGDQVGVRLLGHDAAADLAVDFRGLATDHTRLTPAQVLP